MGLVDVTCFWSRGDKPRRAPWIEKQVPPRSAIARSNKLSLAGEAAEAISCSLFASFSASSVALIKFSKPTSGWLILLVSSRISEWILLIGESSSESTAIFPLASAGAEIEVFKTSEEIKYFSAFSFSSCSSFSPLDVLSTGSTFSTKSKATCTVLVSSFTSASWSCVSPDASSDLVWTFTSFGLSSLSELASVTRAESASPSSSSPVGDPAFKISLSLIKCKNRCINWSKKKWSLYTGPSGPWGWRLAPVSLAWSS